MKAFSATSTFVILLASYASSLPQDKETHVPTKRALIAFGQMVICATNRNPFDYNLYGCYCGFGGKGDPVDDLDRCCKEHDECYTRVVEDQNNCSHDLATYALPYSRKSCLECEPPSYYWFLGECRAAICECDKKAAICFGGSKYNEENAKHDKSSC